MSKDFSKKNQSNPDFAYRFDDFELLPRDRALKKHGVSMALQPKSFDALLCLVGRAERLVSKQELINTLWPDVHVSDANLTNVIVSLRKVVGRDAIRTVSKHGYRFERQVWSEPGVLRPTYERFIRAKELVARRSLESMTLARDLLWTCLAEDPGFAAGWTYLGRCCAFLDKFSSAPSAGWELAAAAFERALTLDADLACAHQFYTLTQVDSGYADNAIERLLSRLRRHPGEIESLAGLVQAFRFRGLIDESLESHRRAVELDPAAVTGVAYTLFLKGEYASTIQAYTGQAAFYLDVAAWATLDERKQAIGLLQQRLSGENVSRLLSTLMSSLLAVLEDRKDDAIQAIHLDDCARDPEIAFYFARHCARIGRIDAAVHAIRRAAHFGFVCAPETLRSDPWLSSLKTSQAFASLVGEVEVLVEQSRSSHRFM